MDNDLSIREMEPDDVPMISSAFSAIGWNKPEGRCNRYCKEQEAGKRVVLVAFVIGEFAGYGNIVWKSDYPPFREQSIPEIWDLLVLPSFRRRGIASAIMDRAEAMISKRSDTVGVGFGLYVDYGPVQRMYVLRGYVPDGQGCTYQHEPVCGGQQVGADDDLVLWLTKRLK
jgi:GNAT superfamily N-acetyltransferase